MLRRELDGLATRQHAIAEVRSAGLLGGIALDEVISAMDVTDDLVEFGYISRPLRGNTLQVSPPFIVDESELMGIIAAIEAAIARRSTLA